MVEMSTNTATMTIILMLSGWAGSGKDAVASLLNDEFDFHRFAFADPLKRDVACFTGLAPEFFQTYLKDVPLSAGGVTPRALLIEHAAEVRAGDPDVYSTRIVEEIRLSKQRRIVVSDWRYVNEYAVIRAAFPEATVVRVRVMRPAIVPGPDPSEHELDDHPMDVYIHNSSTISMLRSTLKDTVRPYIFGLSLKIDGS